ncbi:MAG: PDZ domain-containing protein [Phycisphaeraceae bacterium]|nr:PDZ domain-containing protein [Phycisphaeraceae bacterium]
MELVSTMWTKRIGLMGAGLGLCAAMALAAGRAGEAQGPEEEEVIKGDFNQPLGQTEDTTGNFSRSMMTTVDGSDTFTVISENGKVTVQKNGEKIPKSQFRQKKGNLEILDADGNVIKTLPIGATWNAGEMKGLRGLVGVSPQADAPAGSPNVQRLVVRGQPKVMLGVTMSDADAETLEQIGAKNGAVVLNSVREGLPAAEAGLEANDVIVEADGKPVDGYEALRSVLATKRAGDELALKLFRKGQSKNITVKLAAFDADKMNSIVTIERFGEAGDNSEELVEILKGVEEQVKAQVEALRSQLNATDWNKVRDQVSDALGEAMKQLEEARMQAAEAGTAGVKWWQEHGQNFTMPKGWMQFTPAPSAPAVPPSPRMPRQDVGDKLDRLSEQLDKMNRRLDAMEKQIDKK